VTEVVRLTLVSAAMTDAMVAGRFPVDEPLNDLGRRQVEAVAAAEIAGDTRQFAGPEQRTRQTAELLGLRAAAEPRLADLDCGRWRGEALANIGPSELDTWLTEPAQAPHGGESIVDLVERVAGWLDSLADNSLRIVAVTHHAVIRAAILTALDIPPESFWRIDVAPVGRVVMHLRNDRWTLRL
jgi:broad specificity phosphatase PhoE